MITPETARRVVSERRDQSRTIGNDRKEGEERGVANRRLRFQRIQDVFQNNVKKVKVKTNYKSYLYETRSISNGPDYLS